ncbi:SRPBCC domain-containing protein [Hoyosella sp. G463]|uniref:SRPBCC domain-containing protein n=1 Tax=Lolliginicoccus lacisalsi TaxID=2742202 RepID=A0A927JD68_9ACTN|nr:SRPBCC domain-containing protein [Lolliginicoccus lacisalsi]MBD8507131.1 SRPBCC domain-containing protein [Lolliginicoccus lacisalsi]
MPEHTATATLRDSTLTLARDYAAQEDTLWTFLTEAPLLMQWSPVNPDRDLTSPGPAQTQETPEDEPIDTTVHTVPPPRELAHAWGDDTLEWSIAPTLEGATLTLAHRLSDASPAEAARTATAWHLCLDDLAEALGIAAPASDPNALLEFYERQLGGA